MKDLKASDIFSVDGAPDLDSPETKTISESDSSETEPVSQTAENTPAETPKTETPQTAGPAEEQQTSAPETESRKTSEPATTDAETPAATDAEKPETGRKLPAAAADNQRTDEKAAGEKPRRSHPLFYMIAGAALIILVFMGFLFLRKNETKETVDVTGYLVFTAEGNDGAGKVSVTFDEDRFVNDYGARIQINRDRYLREGLSEQALDEEQPALILAQYLEANITVNADQGKLVNGDTVEAVITADSEALSDIYNVTLTTVNVPFVISGLNKLTSFDPFDGVTIEYSGVSPDATAKIVRSGQALSDNIPMKLDKSTGISNGDVITVSLDVEDPEQYCIEKLGRTPLRTSATYTVTSADSWLSDAEQLTGADLSEIKSSAAKAASGEIAADTGDDTLRPEISYAGYYLFSGSSSSETKNILYVILEVKADDTLSGDDLTDNTWYACVVYENVVITEDGIEYDDPVLEGDNLFVTSSNNTDLRTSHVVGYRTQLQVKKEMLLKSDSRYTVTTDFDLSDDGLQSETG